MTLDFILRHFSELYKLLIISGIICLKLYLMYINRVFVFAAMYFLRLLTHCAVADAARTEKLLLLSGLKNYFFFVWCARATL